MPRTDAGAETFRKDITALEANLQKLEEQEQKYAAELEGALQEYAEVKAQATDLDPVKLYEARQTTRPRYEAATRKKLEQAYGDKYSLLRWVDTKQAQAKLINDSMEEYAVRQLARQNRKLIAHPTHEQKNGQIR